MKAIAIHNGKIYLAELTQCRFSPVNAGENYYEDHKYTAKPKSIQKEAAIVLLNGESI